MKLSDERGFAETAEPIISDKYVAVYWTFDSYNRPTLPIDIEEAAKVSFTIREQRKEIERQASLRGLRRVAEVALQIHPVGMSREDRQRLFDIKQLGNIGDTVLIYTDFSLIGNWRANNELQHALNNTFAPYISIEYPSEQVIEHFRMHKHWESVARQMRANHRAKRKNFIAVNKVRLNYFHGYMAHRLSEMHDLDLLSPGEIAQRLNDASLYTVTGRRWDSDSVRALRRTLLK